MANIREGELLAALRPLLADDTGKADLALEYIEKRAGLLLGQGPRGHERQYTFPHRTFQEYLAACWLADQPDFPQRAVVLARANPAHWREVLTFAARQAKVGRGVPAADALVHVESVAEWSRENQPTETDWRAAVLAGEQLLEIGLAAVNVQEIHRAVRRRVAGWIGAALDSGAVLPACLSAEAKAGRLEALPHLPVAERVKAGAVLARLGDERKGVGVGNGLPDIAWIVIPPGPFKMGDKEEWCGGKRFDCDVIKDPFAISRYPVTVAQYQAFVDAGGYGEQQFWTDAGWKWKQSQKITGPKDSEPVCQTPNHPRVGVSWFEAIAFCRWLTACRSRREEAASEIRSPKSEVRSEAVSLPRLLQDYEVRLPSEAEWERAARHTDGRKFPWGDEEQGIEQRCNLNQTGLGHTSPVGMFPNGLAECGAADLAGNVWEWTRSLWGKDWQKADFNYPYKADDGRENLDAPAERLRVLRGGAWLHDAYCARCACRDRGGPDNRYSNLGFRLVASPFPSAL